MINTKESNAHTAQYISMIADWLGCKYGKFRGRLLQLGITKGDYK